MAQGYRKTKAVLSLLAGGALLAGAGGIWWYRQVELLREERDNGRLEKAQDMLEAGDPRQALVYIPSAFRMAAMDPARIRAWQMLELDAAEKARDIERLVKLYGQIPDEVLKREEASILVSRLLMHSQDMGEYRKLRDAWKGRESMLESWFVLEADQFLVNKDKMGAMNYLQSRSFPGARDAGRLMRLAMIAGERDTDAARGYLDRARNAAPAQPDVHFFLADFYEKMEALIPARLEYLMAFATVPTNIFFGDQVGEFYRRQGDADLAMHVWGSIIDQPFSEPIWIKVLFWSKVMKPATVDLTSREVPSNGPLGPIVTLIASLPPSTFWRDSADLPSAGTASKAIALQCVYWLQLLERLQRGDESKAADLMQLNPNRAKSWKPGLERALIRVLHYRQMKTLQLPGERQDALPPQDETHEIFVGIEEASKKERDRYPAVGVPPEMDALLMNDHVFSWLLLAAGWTEAGLQLAEGLDPMAASAPGWAWDLVYRGLAANRGKGEASAFLESSGRTAPAQDPEGEVELPQGAGFAPVIDVNESPVQRVVRACQEENWSEVHHAVLDLVERTGDLGKASRELRAVEAQFGGAP